MEITVEDIIARYDKEIATLTQRALLAEARADAAQAQIAQLQDEQN